MNRPAAFRGSYSDLKVVKSRSVVQVVVEIPIEQSASFVAAFGMPQPGAEVPVALALLKASPGADIGPGDSHNTGQQSGEVGKSRTPWTKMLRSARAAIRCDDPKFQLWLSNRYPKATCDTAELVRQFCGVKSRADLNENREAAEKFDRLDTQFLMDTNQMAEVR